MYVMPPYPYLATDYGTQLSSHITDWWGSLGAVAHAASLRVRDYDTATRYNDLLDRVLRLGIAMQSYHISTRYG